MLCFLYYLANNDLNENEELSLEQIENEEMEDLKMNIENTNFYNKDEFDLENDDCYIDEKNEQNDTVHLISQEISSYHIIILFIFVLALTYINESSQNKKNQEKNTLMKEKLIFKSYFEKEQGLDLETFLLVQFNNIEFLFRKNIIEFNGKVEYYEKNSLDLLKEKIKSFPRKFWYRTFRPANFLNKNFNKFVFKLSYENHQKQILNKEIEKDYQNCSNTSLLNTEVFENQIGYKEFVFEDKERIPFFCTKTLIKNFVSKLKNIESTALNINNKGLKDSSSRFKKQYYLNFKTEELVQIKNKWNNLPENIKKLQLELSQCFESIESLEKEQKKLEISLNDIHNNNKSQQQTEEKIKKISIEISKLLNNNQNITKEYLDATTEISDNLLKYLNSHFLDICFFEQYFLSFEDFKNILIQSTKQSQFEHTTTRIDSNKEAINFLEENIAIESYLKMPSEQTEIISDNKIKEQVKYFNKNLLYPFDCLDIFVTENIKFIREESIPNNIFEDFVHYIELSSKDFVESLFIKQFLSWKKKLEA